MDNLHLQNFIDNYSDKDFSKIKFDWNNKHGDELRDNNLKFRIELVDFIIPQIKNVKINLIKDLYLELAKFGKEGSGEPKHFNLLAQELILRGYKDYLLDYINGVCYSMDTYLGSGRIDISKELAIEIVKFINERLAVEKDEKIIEMLKSIAGLQRFTWLSENNN